MNKGSLRTGSVKKAFERTSVDGLLVPGKAAQ